MLLGQISRRKEDLNRFIDKLRAQLAVREEQLRRHDELEEIVTSRVETSHKQDKVRLTSLWSQSLCVSIARLMEALGLSVVFS